MHAGKEIKKKKKKKAGTLALQLVVCILSYIKVTKFK